MNHLEKEGTAMYGIFGGYTRWAVVFLIIFVLFFLFVPAYGYGVGAPAAGVAVTKYHTYHTGYPGYSGYSGYHGGDSPYGYDSPASS
jgi:hypothetical protein